MMMGLTESLRLWYFYSTVTVLITANSSVVYLDPITLDSFTCSSQIENISSARNDVSEALRTVVTPYLNRKYGKAENYVRECGGEGWTRMAYLNVTEPNTQCPSNWRLNSRVRGCGRRSRGSLTCDSAHFRNSGLSYNKVCGRIIAYQQGHNDAFWGYINNRDPTVETAYAAGALLTHGPVGSRKHIWTFADALLKQSSRNTLVHYGDSMCPCTATALSWPHNIPPFVGNNYFCDSGNPGPGWATSALYSEDPLWDGAGCPSTNSCCEFNNPPWFNRTLPETTSDDMEVRLCVGDGSEDIIVSLIELYVA